MDLAVKNLMTSKQKAKMKFTFNIDKMSLLQLCLTLSHEPHEAHQEPHVTQPQRLQAGPQVTGATAEGQE